jgi:hypothetical protein
MPFPDSEYPSITRGKDKRESQRLLAAAPKMREALLEIDQACVKALVSSADSDPHAPLLRAIADLAITAVDYTRT